MASLIESVRKLHGPTLVERENGYDVDVICPECTRLRADALDRAAVEDEAHPPELARMPYPCPTRIIAGTTTEEGKDESARMRLEHLVVQRDELEERMERLDAVIGLIRRNVGEEPGSPGSGSPDVPAGSDESEDSPNRADKAASEPNRAAGADDTNSEVGYEF